MFGVKKYHVKLVGVDGLVWVQETDLGRGVLHNIVVNLPLPKSARVYVNRGSVIRQRLFLDKKEVEPSPNNSSPDPIKLAKKTARWVVTCSAWVKSLDNVLDTDVKDLPKARSDTDPLGFRGVSVSVSKVVLQGMWGHNPGCEHHLYRSYSWK